MMLMTSDAYQGDKGRKAGVDFAPGAESVERMTRYNEDLAKAGVRLSLNGLHPPLTGAFVPFPGGKPIVTEGCYVESRDFLGGYWIIKAKSNEEAVIWVKRVPADEDDVVEVRQLFDASGFPEDVWRTAKNRAVEAQVEKNKQAACCT